ncbi:MAG: hypothetical protein ACOYB0_08370 [Polynucleobacter sp.]
MNEPQPRDQRKLARELRSAAERFAHSTLQTTRDKASKALTLAERAERIELDARGFDYGRTLVSQARYGETRPDASECKAHPPVPCRRLSQLLGSVNRLRLNRVTFSRAPGEKVAWCEYDGETLGRIDASNFIFSPRGPAGRDDTVYQGMLELLDLLRDDLYGTIAHAGRLSGLCPYCGYEVVNATARQLHGAHTACHQSHVSALAHKPIHKASHKHSKQGTAHHE